EEIRQALVDELLNRVSAAIDAAGELRAKRGPLLRQAADGREKCLADSLSVRLELRHRADLCFGSILRVPSPLPSPPDIVEHLIGHVVEASDMGAKGEHGSYPSVLSSRGGRSGRARLGRFSNSGLTTGSFSRRSRITAMPRSSCGS